MQKLINIIALLSGLVSLSVVGGGIYLYKNADVLIEDAREKATQAAIEAVSSALPKLVEAAIPDVPELPKTTGPAIPF